ncbi:LuxR C-terminal-related transcriptional regulator [Rhizobium helianthi]|uniref:LuxR C-terminal-related transcriptional regulator n=1 Tax=Rhizobium helianthi TaxID=1132695 RepID=A0ABW4M633_9HYPH
MITLERHSLLSREISSAESRAAILAAVAKLPKQFGFRYFALMSAPAATDSLIDPLIIDGNLPRAYVREFDRLRLLNACPIVPLLKNMALPLCWSFDPQYDDGWPLDFPEPMRRLSKAHGMSTGVAMPLQSSDGSGFMIRLDGDRPLLTLPELNEVGMLMLQSFRVFDRVRRLDPQKKCILTARELEVLRWTSQGKTSSEIAEILSLSDHTVNAYLNKAIKKLDCVNRTQLVAKAIRLRLIT